MEVGDDLIGIVKKNTKLFYKETIEKATIAHIFCCYLLLIEVYIVKEGTNNRK